MTSSETNLKALQETLGKQSLNTPDDNKPFVTVAAEDGKGHMRVTFSGSWNRQLVNAAKIALERAFKAKK